MSELQEIQQLFASATNAIEARYLQREHKADEVTPMQLAEALQHLLQAFEKIDQDYGAHGALPYDDPSDLASGHLPASREIVTCR